MPNLFEPVQVGAMALANRVVMAPLTRNRAPTDLPTGSAAIADESSCCVKG